MKALLRRIGLLSSLIVLVGYVWISIFGLFALNHSEANRCPFVVGQHAVCSLDTLHHIQEWQAFVMATIPQLDLIFVALLLFVSIKFCLSLFSQFLYSHRRYYIQFIPVLLYQYLFSQGILNPKPY